MTLSFGRDRFEKFLKNFNYNAQSRHASDGTRRLEHSLPLDGDVDCDDSHRRQQADDHQPAEELVVWFGLDHPHSHGDEHHSPTQHVDDHEDHSEHHTEFHDRFHSFSWPWVDDN